jgi:hypothetical protein
MKYFLKSIIVFSLCLLIVSCSKSDSSSSEPLRDYATQRDTDMVNIEEFMKSHYMEVVNDPGQTDDQDVKFTLIPIGGTQVSIWDQTDYPKQSRLISVKQGDADIVYKIYYLQLRQGSGTAPCNVDKVKTAYRGEYILKSTDSSVDPAVITYNSTQFQEAKFPIEIDLFTAIRGWGEIFPKFKTGSYVTNSDGTVSYSDFGAGVMFIPSGLAYYSGATGGIPSYSPLIFGFKLYNLERNDQDSDGIPSYLEDTATSVTDLNGTVTILPNVPDGYVNILATGVTNPDDTDGDKKPDFYDIDDDGDGVMTKVEIINSITGLAYPFADIPTCGGTSTLKKYLDPSCH